MPPVVNNFNVIDIQGHVPRSVICLLRKNVETLKTRSLLRDDIIRL